MSWNVLIRIFWWMLIWTLIWILLVYGQLSSCPHYFLMYLLVLYWHNIFIHISILIHIYPFLSISPLAYHFYPYLFMTLEKQLIQISDMFGKFPHQYISLGSHFLWSSMHTVIIVYTAPPAAFCSGLHWDFRTGSQLSVWNLLSSSPGSELYLSYLSAET